MLALKVWLGANKIYARGDIGNKKSLTENGPEFEIEALCVVSIAHSNPFNTAQCDACTMGTKGTMALSLKPQVHAHPQATRYIPFYYF